MGKTLILSHIFWVHENKLDGRRIGSHTIPFASTLFSFYPLAYASSKMSPNPYHANIAPITTKQIGRHSNRRPTGAYTSSAGRAPAQIEGIMKHVARRTHKNSNGPTAQVIALLIALAFGMAMPLEAIATEQDSAKDAIQATMVQDVSPDAQAATAPEAALATTDEAEPTQPSKQQDGFQSTNDLTGSPAAATEPSGEVAATEPDAQPEESASIPQGTTFAYQHDPRDNPSAMKDIVANDNAVYGFSPSPEGTLKGYVTYDWTDPATVEAGRQQRIAYHQSLAELYDMADQMMASGNSPEEIARAVSTRRNEIRLEAYKDDPEGLAKVKARNLELYGNENGGTPEFFYNLYGSWEKVIEKSMSVNSGMDACTGLYDDYYDLYVASGQVPADPVDPTEPDEPTKPEEQTDTAGSSPTASNGKPQAARTSRAGSTAAKLPATGDTTSPIAPLAIAACACLAASAGLRQRRAR